MNINKSYISTENTYAKNNPQYIVVHNTDNFKAGANALAHAKAQHTRQNWCATLWPRPGFRGSATVRGGIKALQQAMNLDYKAGLAVDGIAGYNTFKSLIS